MNRDWDDPKYVQARANVRKRDKYRCLRCNVHGNIQVHHIRPYGDYPELLCDENNMISLCKHCHSLIKGNEAAFAQLCFSLLNPKRSLDVRRMMWKLKQEEEKNE